MNSASTITCPMCGESLTDQPERCPGCGEVLGGVEVDAAFWIDPKLVRLFHKETRWLGAMWVFFGMWPIMFGVGDLALILVDLDSVVFLFEYLLVSGFAILIGVMLIVVGIACRSKKISAMMTGLILGYLSMLLCLASFNLCAILICAVVLVQSHTVLRTARRMKKLGIPLDTPIPEAS